METKKKKSEELEEQIAELKSQLTILTNQVSEQTLKAVKEAESHVHHDSPSPKEIQPSPKGESQLQQEPKKPSHYTNLAEYCPDCQKRMLADAEKILDPELKKKFMDEERARYKSMKNPVMCEGCGQIVESTESECPTCHGRKARKFS